MVFPTAEGRLKKEEGRWNQWAVHIEREERGSGEQRLQPWGTGEPLNPGEKRGAAAIRGRTGSRGYDPEENGEQRLRP
jgi:hypothetical protein